LKVPALGGWEHHLPPIEKVGVMINLLIKKQREPLFLGTQLFFIQFLWSETRFLPGPKAFGRGPGKIRVSEHKNCIKSIESKK
jgi:hypothetical protein